MLKKYFNKRDLLFGFLFLLIFVSTCIGWQKETRAAKEPVRQIGN